MHSVSPQPPQRPTLLPSRVFTGRASRKPRGQTGRGHGSSSTWTEGRWRRCWGDERRRTDVGQRLRVQRAARSSTTVTLAARISDRGVPLATKTRTTSRPLRTGRGGIYTAISICRVSTVRGRPLSARTSRQSTIASRMLSTASSLAPPWLTHPGMAGHSATLVTGANDEGGGVAGRPRVCRPGSCAEASPLPRRCAKRRSSRSTPT